MAKTVAIAVVLSIILVVGVLGKASACKKDRYVNVTENAGELCNRPCVQNDKRVCYFKFVPELYQAMGVACGNCAKGVVEDCNKPQCIVGDGIEKGVMSINRQIPGPEIQVCHHDLIIVDVDNRALGSAATFHWHGIHMVDTPYMDGVPYVTQCTIPYSTTFRYWFEASEPGTHFYHSHSGHHKINGQYGALIVRQPEIVIPNLNEYDFDLPEHYILISDWMHDYGEQLFPGLPSTATAPNSLLINGRGTYIDPTTMKQTNIPARIYLVKPGKTFRFRLINSLSSACSVQFQIQGHSFGVIASDSFDLKRQKFDTLVTNSGERYDFVLHANYTKGDFWMRVRGMGACAGTPMDSFALVRYETIDPAAESKKSQPPFPAFTNTYPTHKVLNDASANCSNHDIYNSCVTGLSALEDDEELRTKEPDQKIFVAFNNILVPNSEIFQPGRYPHFQNPFKNLTFVGAINNISFVFPASPPLTQPFENYEFCDEFHWPKHCAGKEYCSCTHRIKIEKDTIVEFIIVDEAANAGSLNHPFHLHGNRFMVTGLGHHPLGVPMTLKAARRIEKSEGLVRCHQNDRPPFKDTVSIPNRGYGVIRLRADNPGFWLMHCHYEWHFASGMGVIIQVGNVKQMVKAPKDFPKCSSYSPRIKMPKY